MEHVGPKGAQTAVWRGQTVVGWLMTLTTLPPLLVWMWLTLPAWWSFLLSAAVVFAWRRMWAADRRFVVAMRELAQRCCRACGDLRSLHDPGEDPEWGWCRIHHEWCRL
jgi:hypothetical protein